MSATNEKAAGVLPTPATASKSLYDTSLSVAGIKSNLEADYRELQERFTKTGCTLTRSHRAHDGHIIYVVTRFGQSRYYAHLHDVKAHLNAVEVNR